MSRCVDYEDLKLCVKQSIERNMTLQQFAEFMDEWTDFVEGQRWRYRHADPKLDEWPEDNQTILLTIVTQDPKGIEVVAGAYNRDEGWMVDYEDDYGEFYISAWMPKPEPWT